MATYKRTELCADGAYQLETTIDDNGSYKQTVVWPDGETVEKIETTVTEMGWPSTKEFLEHRRGFEKQEETP